MHVFEVSDSRRRGICLRRVIRCVVERGVRDPFTGARRGLQIRVERRTLAVVFCFGVADREW